MVDLKDISEFHDMNWNRRHNNRQVIRREYGLQAAPDTPEHCNSLIYRKKIDPVFHI